MHTYILACIIHKLHLINFGQSSLIKWGENYSENWIELNDILVRIDKFIPATAKFLAIYEDIQKSFWQWFSIRNQTIIAIKKRLMQNDKEFRMQLSMLLNGWWCSNAVWQKKLAFVQEIIVAFNIFYWEIIK